MMVTDRGIFNHMGIFEPSRMDTPPLSITHWYTCTDISFDYISRLVTDNHNSEVPIKISVSSNTYSANGDSLILKIVMADPFISYAVYLGSQIVCRHKYSFSYPATFNTNDRWGSSIDMVIDNIHTVMRHIHNDDI